MLKQLTRNRNILWTSAAVSVVEPNSQQEVVPTIDPIPEPPPIPQNVVEEAVNELNALGEQSLTSLGLAGHTPVGLVQTAFEYLHVTMGLDWWAAIAVGKNQVTFCY